METIKHEGEVVFQKGNIVGIKISRQSACSQCVAKDSCGLINSQAKVIEISDDANRQFTPGEIVTVRLEATSGFLAVFLSYGLPLILMLAALISVYLVSKSEINGGISAIIILIPYYFWLFLNKKKLAAKFRFTISPKE